MRYEVMFFGRTCGSYKTEQKAWDYLQDMIADHQEGMWFDHLVETGGQYVGLLGIEGTKAEVGSDEWTQVAERIWSAIREHGIDTAEGYCGVIPPSDKDIIQEWYEQLERDYGASVSVYTHEDYPADLRDGEYEVPITVTDDVDTSRIPIDPPEGWAIVRSEDWSHWPIANDTGTYDCTVVVARRDEANR